MVGFFEHQYLSFKKGHLLNLVALAKADGYIHENESRLLHKIGLKYGLKARQVDELIAADPPQKLKVPSKHGQKMNQLYDLITMVHADGIVNESEVTFCEHLMEHFGYQKEIVQWMISHFESGEPPHIDPLIYTNTETINGLCSACFLSALQRLFALP